MRGGAVHIQCYGSFSALSTEEGGRSESMCDIRGGVRGCTCSERVRKLNVREKAKCLINLNISVQLKHNMNLSSEQGSNTETEE